MHKYYDIEINLDEILSQNGEVDSYFYLNDLKNRRLFLNSEIDIVSVDEIVRHILRYNTDDADIDVENRKPIILFVSSPGGDAYAGFQLIDTIESSVTPVYTVNLGYQFSMGFLIGLSGKKRFCTEHSKFLWHDGVSGTYNSSSKVRDTIDFQKKDDERIKEYVLSRSKITSELYDEKSRVEWYMFADEAKELGVTDYIIGKDCQLQAII